MVSRLALALALIAGPAGAAAAATTTIGTAAAVNPASTSVAPGSASRIIRVGNNVVRDERIKTSAAGSVQLLFVDRTTMSIGPDSDVVLDSYVYNPDTSTGRMAVTFGKGLMRFVGGEVTHNGEADIKTSAGVIGIRGGVVLLEAGRQATGSADDVLKITVAFGHAFLHGRFGLTTLSPGQTALVGPNGHVSVRLTTTADVQHHNSAMEKGAGHGTVHLSAGIVAAQLGTGASGTLGAPPLPPEPTPNTATNNPSSPPVTPNVVQTTSTSQGTQQTAGGGGNNPGGGAGGSVFAFSMSHCCTTTNPTSNTAYVPTPAAIPLSAVYGFKPTTSPANAGLPVIQAGVGFQGSGASQSSELLVMAGAVDGGKLSGDYYGSARFNATEGQSLVQGAFSGSGAGSQPIPSSGTISSTSASYDNSNSNGVPTAPTSYSFTQSFSSITPPAGLGKIRPDFASTGPLLGFSGGIMDSINHAKGTVQHFAVSGGFGGFFLVADRSSGIVYSGANVQKVGASGFDATYAFGFDVSNSGGHFYRGAYIDSDHFAALDARDANGKSFSTVNGTTVMEGRGAMVSSGFVDTSKLNGVTACTCQYTKWGFWSVQDVRPGGNIEDRSHLMEWVAGQMPDQLGRTIPTTGTATYGGHVVASIQNGNAGYVAAGKFAGTVDFGANKGTVQVTRLDGYNYSGKIALNAGNRATFGTVREMVGRDATTDAATRLRMAASGAFFGSKANPAKEMGGNVTIHGLTPGGQRYLGSGVFAASK